MPVPWGATWRVVSPQLWIREPHHDPLLLHCRAHPACYRDAHTSVPRGAAWGLACPPHGIARQPPVTPFPLFPCRGPAAADGEPGDALQGGAAAAAAAAEAAAAEGAEGREGSVPLGAQPQGRAHQQQQQRLQRGQPGPGLRGLGLEAGGQGRDEIRVCRSIESRGPGGLCRGVPLAAPAAGRQCRCRGPGSSRFAVSCDQTPWADPRVGGEPLTPCSVGFGAMWGGAAGAAPSLQPPQPGGPGTRGGPGAY